ncbi:hypothetical protein [Auraticoccus monumenti]|uniref:hypothetical protein n=1 Tax=Auraticoccus monumenti TaxID=675864 RepID=UPI0012F95503|nr:hypothetical protein [Auraticoccus monumenti]
MSPAEVHQCASGIGATAIAWGEGAATVARSPRAVDALGSGEAAEVLRSALGAFHPEATAYGDELGFCLSETSVALHAVAQVYDDVETENEEMADRLDEIITSLGTV